LILEKKKIKMSEQSKIGNFFKKVSQKVYDLKRLNLNQAITLTFNALGAQLADLDYHEDYQASDSESSQDYQDDHDAGSDSE
jgi:hypothetical protein